MDWCPETLAALHSKSVRIKCTWRGLVVNCKICQKFSAMWYMQTGANLFSIQTTCVAGMHVELVCQECCEYIRITNC